MDMFRPQTWKFVVFFITAFVSMIAPVAVGIVLEFSGPPPYLLHEDRVEALARRREIGEQFSLVGLDSIVGTQVALAAPELVEAKVACDRVDPAPEVERIVDAIHHAQCLHERLLRDVLGQQRVSELASDEAIDGRHVATVQLLERVDVTVAVGLDQLDV